jgi:LPS sulfotransferase NodH
VIGYVVCTQPRSGSNYYGDLLYSTGKLGRPIEWLDAGAVAKAGFGTPFETRQQQLTLVTTLGATDNAVYGLKLFPYQLRSCYVDGFDPFDELPNLKFVYLERHDLLGQAISHVRAQQTDQWTSHERPNSDPTYDVNGINNELYNLLRDRGDWNLYFASNGLAPLRVYYEDVVRNPQGAADQLADFLGVPHAKIGTVNLNVQRDALNESWRTQFVKDRAGLGV